MPLKKIVKIFKWPLNFNWLLLKSCFISLFFEFCLRFNWYRFTKQLHSNITTSQPENKEVAKELILVARAMKILEKFAPWRPKCYNRALTAKQILLKKNIITKMHIGFRKKDGKFDGHAWITFNNKFVTGLVKDIEEFEQLK